MYINSTWLHTTHIPPYLSSYSVSDEIEDLINEELLTIIDNARDSVLKKMKTPDMDIPTSTYLIGTFTESVLNSNRSSDNLRTVQLIVSEMRCVRNTEEIGKILGEFIKFQIRSILDCSILISELDTSTYRLTFGPGDLGLPNISYYDLDTKEKRHAMNEYKKLIAHLKESFLIPGNEDFVEFEQYMAKIIYECRQEDEVILKGSKLLSDYPNIPWKPIIEIGLGWSLSKFSNTQCLILSKSWLKQLNTWFRTLSLDTWKQCLSIHLLMNVLSLLPPPYNDWHFELFGHTMRGQTIKTPQHRLALQLVEKWLSVSLGEVFIKTYVSPSIKKDVTSIAKEIRHSAAKRIGSTEWFSPITQKKAQKKVQSTYLSIAYPSVFPKDDKITLNPDNVIENVFLLSALDFKSETEKINKKLDLTKWEDSVFAVNAYYYNEGNHLILPSGILRWPFFSSGASDGWNFGGLGATIGHELCHAFDDDGKEYDQFGNKKPWWTKKEIDTYQQKTESIIDLYDSTYYYSAQIDGVNTLNENIADLGGLAIALSALKSRLKKNISTIEYKKNLCDFFISYAVSWRTKEKKQKALQSIFMDVHSPPNARVNNIVCQFDDWYDCFNVQPGDALYKSPEERIRIF